MPGPGTSDGILLKQPQERYLVTKKGLYFPFVDLEKAFDRVRRDMALRV